MPAPPNPKAKNWCFTINNPPDDLDKATLHNDEYFQYAIWGREVGESGTPHFQGYVQFTKQRSRVQVSALLPTAHLEIQKARSNIDAQEYCKKDGAFEEFGSFIDNMKNWV